MTANDPAEPRTSTLVHAESFGLSFGQVKIFSLERGFGFIRTTHDIEAFMRMRDLIGTTDQFRPGDLVEFTLYRGDRGWFARDIARLPNDPVVFWAWRKADALPR